MTEESSKNPTKQGRFRGPTWESNLIVGVVCLVGGSSGKFSLVGTESSLALAIVGGGLLVWGGLQWWFGRSSL